MTPSNIPQSMTHTHLHTSNDNYLPNFSKSSIKLVTSTTNNFLNGRKLTGI